MTHIPRRVSLKEMNDNMKKHRKRRKRSATLFDAALVLLTLSISLDFLALLVIGVAEITGMEAEAVVASLAYASLALVAIGGLILWNLSR